MAVRKQRNVPWQHGVLCFQATAISYQVITGQEAVPFVASPVLTN